MKFEKNLSVLILITLIGAVSADLLFSYSSYLPYCRDDEVSDFFPHDTNCSLFYACSYGELTLLECPDNLYFDPVNKICDYPELAGCEHQITSTTEEPSTESTTPKPTTPESTTPVSTTPESTTPISTTPVSTTPESTTPESTTPESTTPESTTPESTTPESTTPEYTTPESTTPESTTPESTTSLLTTSDCMNSDIFFDSHETDCFKFYAYRSGYSYLLHCKLGWEFDFSAQNCVEISSNGCTASKIESNKNSLRKPHCPNDAILIYIPHESDCQKYYSCSFGTLTLFSCRDGYHFNPIEFYCDLPENAGCEFYSTTEKPESTSEETSTPGCRSIRTSLSSHETNSSKFYINIDGILYLTQCSEGKTFDISVRDCIKTIE